jgi:glycine cleavage system transcriptional repressor
MLEPTARLFSRTVATSLSNLKVKAPSDDLFNDDVNTEQLNWSPRYCVVTATGSDGLGVVNRLMKAFDACEGQLQESRMTILGRDFSVSAMVLIPDFHTADDLHKQVTTFLPNFTIGVRETQSSPFFRVPTMFFDLTAQGADSPGAVTALTKLLAAHKIAIRDLATDMSSAPFSGYRLLTLRSLIAIPRICQFEALHADIERFEEDFGFDISLEVAGADKKAESEAAEEELRKNDGSKPIDDDASDRQMDATSSQSVSRKKYTDVTN